MATMREISNWVCSRSLSTDCPSWSTAGGGCNPEYCVSAFLYHMYENVGGYGDYFIDATMAQMPQWEEHTCARCGKTEEQDNYGFFRLSGAWGVYNYVCSECRVNHVVSCASCGAMNLDTYMITVDGIHFCNDICSDRYERNKHRRLIQGYHNCSKETKGASVKRLPHEGYDTHLFGMEIEVDGDDTDVSFASDVERIFNARDIKVFQEEDGSLGDDGWELIFQPMSYAYIMENLDVFDEILRVKWDKGFDNSEARAGMHIHISKRSLGINEYSRKESIAKMMLIVDRFYNDLVKISGRTPYSINQWARPHDTQTISHCRNVLFNSDMWGGEKYRALNICPHDTVECRLWDSPNELPEFIAYLDATNAIVQSAIERSAQSITACKSLRSVLKYGMTEHLSNHMELVNL